MNPDAYIGNPAELAGLSPEELDAHLRQLWAQGRKAEYDVFLREWQRRGPESRLNRD